MLDPYFQSTAAGSRGFVAPNANTAVKDAGPVARPPSTGVPSKRGSCAERHPAKRRCQVDAKALAIELDLGDGAISPSPFSRCRPRPPAPLGAAPRAPFCPCPVLRHFRPAPRTSPPHSLPTFLMLLRRRAGSSPHHAACIVLRP